MAKETMRENLEQLAQELLEKRQLAATLENTRVKSDIKRVRAERSLVEKEAEHLLRVLNAKDEAGKLTYSNESSRKAELTCRMAADEQVIALIKLIDRAKLRSARLELDQQVVRAQAMKLATMEKLYLIEMEKRIL